MAPEAMEAMEVPIGTTIFRTQAMVHRTIMGDHMDISHEATMIIQIVARMISKAVMLLSSLKIPVRHTTTAIDALLLTNRTVANRMTTRAAADPTSSRIAASPMTSRIAGRLTRQLDLVVTGTETLVVMAIIYMDKTKSHSQ